MARLPLAKPIDEAQIDSGSGRTGRSRRRAVPSMRSSSAGGINERRTRAGVRTVHVEHLAEFADHRFAIMTTLHPDGRPQLSLGQQVDEERLLCRARVEYTYTGGV